MTPEIKRIIKDEAEKLYQSGETSEYVDGYKSGISRGFRLGIEEAATAAVNSDHDDVYRNIIELLEEDK